MLRGALWTKKLNAVNIAFILTERQTIAMKTTLILSSRILIGALITNLLNKKADCIKTQPARCDTPLAN